MRHQSGAHTTKPNLGRRDGPETRRDAPHDAAYMIYTKTESVTAILQELNWETLEQRRLKARVVMGYRIVNDLVMIPKDQLIPNTSSTKGHHMKFHKIYATLFPAFIPLWNALPTSAVSAATIDVFKEELAGEILMKPY